MDALSQLTGATRVYLDTQCFIYFLEKHPILFPVILPIFEAAMNGDYQIVTSELTLAELLIRPYQLGRSDIAITYREFLADIEIVTLTPISLNMLDKAAAIRAAHNGVSHKCSDLHLKTSSMMELGVNGYFSKVDF
jgi:predicted nucleic acid-binding protein